MDRLVHGAGQALPLVPTITGEATGTDAADGTRTTAFSVKENRWKRCQNCPMTRELSDISELCALTSVID